MKLDIVKDMAIGGVKRIGFKMSKYAPEALVIGGVIGGVTAAVLACRATMRIKDNIDTYKSVAEVMDEDAADPDVKYTAEQAKAEKRDLAIQTGITVAKAYAPAVGLGALSISAILYGHNMRHKRYLAAAAAWAASQADYKALLDRIKRDHGEDEMYRLKYDAKDVVEEYKEENEDGSVTEGVRSYSMATNPPSLYSIFFDETNPNWQKSPIHNKQFLMKAQAMANDRFKRKGFLTLNEVYEMLGHPTNPLYGNEAGWIQGSGDDYVDFGIFDDLDDNPQKRAFINGYERSILLDFNCVGRIREYAEARGF